MGQFRQITKSITVAGGSSTGRVWDAPTGVPLKNISILINSNGTPTAAGDLDWEVFYGGKWDGTPFDSASTHSGGISQGSGTIAGGTEVCNIVHTDTDVLPANNPALPSDRKGFPIVLELTNDKGTSLTIDVTFTSETVSTNV